MSRLSVIAFIVTCIVPAISVAEEKFTVSGVGSHPISHSIVSMWLAAPDHRPLLMVYFHGPQEWHNTKWKIDSKFEKGKPGWAELQSERVTLRLSMNTDTSEAEVQSGKFKITDSNTFLVLHTAEPSALKRSSRSASLIFRRPRTSSQPRSCCCVHIQSSWTASTKKLGVAKRNPLINRGVNWRNIPITLIALGLSAKQLYRQPP